MCLDRSIYDAVACAQANLDRNLAFISGTLALKICLSSGVGAAHGFSVKVGLFVGGTCAFLLARQLGEMVEANYDAIFSKPLLESLGFGDEGSLRLALQEPIRMGLSTSRDLPLVITRRSATRFDTGTTPFVGSWVSAFASALTRWNEINAALPSFLRVPPVGLPDTSVVSGPEAVPTDLLRIVETTPPGLGFSLRTSGNGTPLLVAPNDTITGATVTLAAQDPRMGDVRTTLTVDVFSPRDTIDWAAANFQGGWVVDVGTRVVRPERHAGGQPRAIGSARGVGQPAVLCVSPRRPDAPVRELRVRVHAAIGSEGDPTHPTEGRPTAPLSFCPLATPTPATTPPPRDACAPTARTVG